MVCSFYFSDFCQSYDEATGHDIPACALDTSFSQLELKDVSQLIWRGYQLLLAHKHETSTEHDFYDSVAFTTYVSEGIHPLDLGKYS
jgi:hypothetical protein